VNFTRSVTPYMDFTGPYQDRFTRFSLDAERTIRTEPDDPANLMGDNHPRRDDLNPLTHKSQVILPDLKESRLG
jgi:hypothetical protein